MLRLIYGFNPFRPPKSKHASLAVVDAYVYLIGVNGEKKLLNSVDDTDLDNRSLSWKNSCLTIARQIAERHSKFYGIKPERVENNKVVPRSLNYAVLMENDNAKTT